MIRAALSKDRPLLSQAIIKAINFHAIAGLHHQAGEYRTFSVTAGNFVAPQYYRVQPLMDDMINVINYKWQNCNVVELAAYALWRVNYIHPFCNGNGRTARAVCYFIICVKSGGTLPGKTILPELLKGNRWEYIEALKSRDQGDVGPLISLLCRLLTEQLETASGNTR
ncbi:MAG: Fic family protein [Gammaproteobacteria bacterium]|nr:Fic family protein [Gammaproteobacteria bacterium]